MAKLKKLSKKAEKYFKSDVRLSLILTSLLLNVFFFSGIIALNTTNLLDEPLYDLSKHNLCVKNYSENLQSRLQESSNKELTRLSFEAKCEKAGFQPYYQNAKESFFSEEI